MTLAEYSKFPKGGEGGEGGLTFPGSVSMGVEFDSGFLENVNFPWVFLSLMGLNVLTL